MNAFKDLSSRIETLRLTLRAGASASAQLAAVLARRSRESSARMTTAGFPHRRAAATRTKARGLGQARA